MKYYKNNLEGLDKLREVLELSLRMICENIESSSDEENLKELEIVKEDDLLSIGEFANLLRLKGVPFGRNKVHSWLSNRNYTQRKNNKNYAIPKYIDEGMFKVKTYIVNTVDGPIETETIYLTSKGIKYFMKKILSEFNIKES